MFKQFSLISPLPVILSEVEGPAVPCSAQSPTNLRVPHPLQPHRKGWAARLPNSHGLRFTLLCLIVVLTLATSAATDPSARLNKLGHEMICTCSCGQILMECNHVGCPVSGPMIAELQTQLTGGGTDTSIFNWFAAKYGAIVLAAPIRGGFDNVAWIAPMAVFFFATIGTAVLIRVWKLRSSQTPVAAAGPGNAASNALRERIRRETEY